jgi:hypothetical protein
MRLVHFVPPSATGGAGFLVALLLASPAGAVERYVSTSGSATYAAASNPATPMSLTTANSGATAGDVLRLRAGNYGSSDINPAASGTSGSRITYRPDTLGNPVHVDQIVLASGRSYISVWNVNTTNSALRIAASAGATRTGDSLLNVTAARPAQLHNFTNSVFYNCTIGDTTTTLGGTSHVDANNWTNVTLRRSRILIHSNSAATVRPFYPGSWTGCTIDSTQWYFVLDTGSEQGSMFRQSTNNNFKDNHWRVWDRGGRTNGIGLGFRDNTIGNFSFVRDTFTDLSGTRGGSAVTFARGSGTSSPANNMSWSHCVFRMGLGFLPANGSNNWDFDHCQIAVYNRSESSGGNSCMFQPLAGNLTNLSITHCSILYYRGFGQSGNNAEKLFSDQVDLGSLTFTDNVVMRMQYGAGTACPTRGVANTSSSAPTWNRNVYYLYNKHAGPDSAQATYVSGSCSGAGPGTTACGSWGNDCNSRWGGVASNMIADTTWNPQSGKPDFTPSSTGLIVHSLWPDGYVGAVRPSGVVDLVPPATIQNLGASGAEPQAAPSAAIVGDGRNSPRTPGSESDPTDGSTPRLKPAPWSPPRRP